MEVHKNTERARQPTTTKLVQVYTDHIEIVIGRRSPLTHLVGSREALDRGCCPCTNGTAVLLNKLIQAANETKRKQVNRSDTAYKQRQSIMTLLTRIRGCRTLNNHLGVRRWLLLAVAFAFAPSATVAVDDEFHGIGGKNPQDRGRLRTEEYGNDDAQQLQRQLAQYPESATALASIVNLNNGLTPALLSNCQGNCDSDWDCIGVLKCFMQGDDTQQVPGCSGEREAGINYCYYDVDTAAEEFDREGRTTDLGMCEGGCDNDEGE